MSDHIGVIESPEYGDDARALQAHPEIRAMAEQIRADGYTDRFLADPEAQSRAYHEANRRGVEFRFIGSPLRALTALLRPPKG